MVELRGFVILNTMQTRGTKEGRHVLTNVKRKKEKEAERRRMKNENRVAKKVQT